MRSSTPSFPPDTAASARTIDALHRSRPDHRRAWRRGRCRFRDLSVGGSGCHPVGASRHRVDNSPSNIVDRYRSDCIGSVWLGGVRDTSVRSIGGKDRPDGRGDGVDRFDSDQSLRSATGRRCPKPGASDHGPSSLFMAPPGSSLRLRPQGRAAVACAGDHDDRRGLTSDGLTDVRGRASRTGHTNVKEW